MFRKHKLQLVELLTNITLIWTSWTPSYFKKIFNNNNNNNNNNKFNCKWAVARWQWL
jgi:hypothetical protein